MPNKMRTGACNAKNLEKWVSDFLSYWQDRGMSNGETAEMIFAKVETCLPISEKTISIPLEDPKEIFQARLSLAPPRQLPHGPGPDLRHGSMSGGATCEHQ